MARVDELRRWDVDGETVRLGAGVTCTQLMQPPLAEALPALAQAARTVGSPQIRNAATIGGNLGTGSPAGDLLPVLSALDTAIVVRSLTGSRVLSIHQFLVGPKRTALRPGELVTEAVVALPKGPQEFMKVGVRNAMVIAIANLALVVDHGALRVAAGSVGPTVIRARDAEQWAEANGGVNADPEEFGQRVAAEVRPIDDHRSTAAYRRRAVEVMAARALREGRGRVSEHYRLTINGEHREVQDAWAGESLLYVLRERLGLPGAKGACEQGECGSCSVVVDGTLVCSCLVLAASVVDREITTVEGLTTDGSLSDVQRAFVAEGAVQCGFCTPGLIVAVHDLLERVPDPDPLAIREALSGNLCRCTGYGRIFAAVQAAARERNAS